MLNQVIKKWKTTKCKKATKSETYQKEITLTNVKAVNHNCKNKWTTTKCVAGKTFSAASMQRQSI